MVAEADPGEALFAALDAGDLGEANDILDRSPGSVDTRDGELRVPLHYAADCADLGTFQRIFNLNRSLMDAQDQFGFTPLLIAAMAGNVEVLEFLVEQGAQLGQLDRDGHSAVHWAVVCGQLDALIALLQHGGPTALANIHGAHPLHYATVASEQEIPAERSEAILHVLLRHEAPLECADLDGRTPLLWAASDGNVRAFQSLIQAGANRFATDRDRLAVLHCAASHGHLPIVQSMLELGHHWVVNAKDRNGDTPLFYAATYGHVECLKLLLERGADPNHQDRRIRTAAHCAAAKGQLRVLKLLRQFGASFELQNYRGDLPVHEAVQTGSKDIVDWLLGIEPSMVAAPNFYGRTPLHLAACAGNMELVVLLCSRGAPVNALMLYKGELLTPVDLARRRGHDLVVDYLTRRHEALSATQVPVEHRDSSKQSIEEQLKTAKLRKVRAELLSNDEDGAMANKSKSLMRGKSMLVQRDGPTEGSLEMVDASTMVSRRSSSASGGVFHRKMPKSTSTTDLMSRSFVVSFNRKRMEVGRGLVEEVDELGRREREEEESQQQMEQRIQRIVQLELQKAKHAAAIGNGHAKGGEEVEEEQLEQEATASFSEENNGEEYPPTDSTGGEGTNLEMGQHHWQPKAGNSKENAEQKGGKKVHLAQAGNGTDEQQQKSPKQIRRRWTPFHHQTEEEAEADRRRESLDEAVTELHILEEGLSPPPAGRMASMGEPAGTATRYVHERAIFDELTHLKRMQIQYGKVREEVLVRSLVQNFCRMHAINPSHFRRIHTFHQWEKFLYDQLKGIYLEERERLSHAAEAAAQKAASAVGMRPGSIYQSQQRIFASSSSTNFGGRHFTSNSSMGSGLLHKKFDTAALARTNPLDQRLHELSRIYSGGSNSRSSQVTSAIAVTNSITKRASAIADSQRRRQNSKGRQAAEKPGEHKTPTNRTNANNDQKKDEAVREKEPQKHYKRCECLETS